MELQNNAANREVPAQRVPPPAPAPPVQNAPPQVNHPPRDPPPGANLLEDENFEDPILLEADEEAPLREGEAVAREEVGVLKSETACCCLLVCVVLPLWFIGTKLMRTGLEEYKPAGNSLSHAFDSWKQDTIVGFSATSREPMASTNQYKTRWLGIFPFNEKACYCDPSSNGKITKGVECNFLEENLFGCISVPKRDQKILSYWTQSQLLFLVRNRGTSFVDLYDKIDSNGVCKAGYKNCGDRNSKSKGLCIPESAGDCPFTKASLVQNAATPVPHKINPNLTIYTSSNNSTQGYTSNPFVEAKIVENFMCISSLDYSESPERRRHPLLRGYSTYCLDDPNQVILATRSENDVFRDNGVDLEADKIPNWEFKGDEQKYALVMARQLEWAPECAHLVPKYANWELPAKTLSTSESLLVIRKSVTAIFFVMLLFVCCGSANNLNATAWRMRYLGYFIVGILWMFLIPDTIEMFRNIRDTTRDLLEIRLNHNCTTHRYNEYFNSVYQGVYFSASPKIILGCFLVWASFAFTLMAFCCRELLFRGHEIERYGVAVARGRRQAAPDVQMPAPPPREPQQPQAQPQPAAPQV